MRLSSIRSGCAALSAAAFLSVMPAGQIADVTIFDPATVREVSTFDDPTHYAIGTRPVLVNARRVGADGRITTEQPGRPLRGPATT